MKATLEPNRSASGPGTLPQLVKINQLIAEQNPSSDQLQQLMRFLPDILRADLGRLTRYDLHTFLLLPLPFTVLSEEFYIPNLSSEAIESQLFEFVDIGVIKSNACMMEIRRNWGHVVSPDRAPHFVVDTNDEARLHTYGLRVAYPERMLACYPYIAGSRFPNLSCRLGSRLLKFVKDKDSSNFSHLELHEYNSCDAQPTLVTRNYN